MTSSASVYNVSNSRVESIEYYRAVQYIARPVLIHAARLSFMVVSEARGVLKPPTARYVAGDD